MITGKYENVKKLKFRLTIGIMLGLLPGLDNPNPRQTCKVHGIGTCINAKTIGTV
jgi:hypothetical protein